MSRIYELSTNYFNYTTLTSLRLPAETCDKTIQAIYDMRTKLIGYLKELGKTHKFLDDSLTVVQSWRLVLFFFMIPKRHNTSSIEKTLTK